MATVGVSEVSFAQPVSVRCRPRPKSAASAQNRGVPGWLIGFFAVALLLSVAALVLTLTLRNDLAKIAKNQATVSTLRSRFRFASLMTYLTFVFVLIVMCILVVNKNSFVRYGLVSSIALLLLLGQAVLLQSAVDDAIIIIERTKTKTPALNLKPATFAVALSGVTTVALLIGFILAVTDNRNGRDEDALNKNVFAGYGGGGASASASMDLVDLDTSVQTRQCRSRSVTMEQPVTVVEKVTATPLIPISEKTSTVISQQPPRAVVIEKLVPVLPPQPPKTQAAMSFDTFLSRLGKPAPRSDSYVVPL